MKQVQRLNKNDVVKSVLLSNKIEIKFLVFKERFNVLKQTKALRSMTPENFICFLSKFCVFLK